MLPPLGRACLPLEQWNHARKPDGPRQGGCLRTTVAVARCCCRLLVLALLLDLGMAALHFLVQDDALLDDIIDRLLDVRTGRPGRQVALSETEVSKGAQLQCALGY